MELVLTIGVLVAERGSLVYTFQSASSDFFPEPGSPMSRHMMMRIPTNAIMMIVVGRRFLSLDIRSSLSKVMRDRADKSFLCALRRRLVDGWPFTDLCEESSDSDGQQFRVFHSTSASMR